MRRLFSFLLLAFTLLLLYPLLPLPELLAFAIPAGLTFLSGALGYISLALLGVLLVYHKPPGGLALLGFSFALIYVESVYLAKRRAPFWHYVLLFSAVLMAVPFYYFRVALAGFLPSLTNTVVASIFILVLYGLLHMVVRR